MGMNKLDNCPKCGNLFLRSIRDICHSCYQEEEREYQLVVDYIRNSENSKATIDKVRDDTGVSIKLITKFIRQKRISLYGLPNMGYPCESCGMMTRDGHLCPSCREKFTKGVDRVLKDDALQTEKGKYTIKDTGYRHVKDDIKE